MIRNYVKMLLGLPVLLFAGNCCLGAETENVEINAQLTVDEQITLTKPVESNITLSHKPSGSAHGITNIAYAGLSGEFSLSSNIHNPQYNIKCTPAEIDTQGGGTQNYQGYLYQNETANANDIMQQEVAITHDSNDASNTAKFQLLFVLPSGTNYQTGTYSSTTTCTILSA